MKGLYEMNWKSFKKITKTQKEKGEFWKKKNNKTSAATVEAQAFYRIDS